MDTELKIKLEELLTRMIPWDTVSMRLWIVEAKVVLDALNEADNDASV